MSEKEDEAAPYGDEKSREYKAAGGSKRNMFLLFVPHPQGPSKRKYDRFLPFSDIRQMEVLKDGTLINIDFSNTTVEVTGKNLRAVATNLGAHACSRLEAFDEKIRNRPTDKEAPFIESIEYYSREDEPPQDAESAKH